MIIFAAVIAFLLFHVLMVLIYGIFTALDIRWVSPIGIGFFIAYVITTGSIAYSFVQLAS